MDINILQVSINYIIPLILGAIIGTVSTKFKRNRKKEKAIEEGLHQWRMAVQWYCRQRLREVGPGIRSLF